MSRGRHVARRGGLAVALLVGLSLLLLSGAGSAVAAYDKAASSKILPGVRIAGVDVGEMTRERALAAVTKRAERDLDRSIEITAGGRTWTTTLRELGLSTDVTSVVDSALGVTGEHTWLSRVYHRLSKKPVERSFELEWRYDEAPVLALVRKIFLATRVEPRNASLSLVDGAPVMVEDQPGRQLKSWIARRVIAQAVEKRAPRVELSMKKVDAEVTEENLGATLTVDLTTNTLRLYDGFEVIREYRVATAAQGYETPTGTWTIYNKVENPTWVNGAQDTWGANLPDVIPPGPGNPLGTRALYLDAPGIRIHGTYDDASIGTYASHGCIRMHIPESEELYPLVPIGTQVLVYGSPPWGNVVDPGEAGV